MTAGQDRARSRAAKVTGQLAVNRPLESPALRVIHSLVDGVELALKIEQPDTRNKEPGQDDTRNQEPEPENKGPIPIFRGQEQGRHHRMGSVWGYTELRRAVRRLISRFTGQATPAEAGDGQ